MHNQVQDEAAGQHGQPAIPWPAGYPVASRPPDTPPDPWSETSHSRVLGNSGFRCAARSHVSEKTAPFHIDVF